jgi:hypothetical protein
VTGSSNFDFEGDGKAEVVYGDERRLRVYDGATGAVRFDVPHASGTTYENPVIVDVDGDNNAEIVVASNNYAFSGPTGIRVFRDRKDGWVNTRRIWNQHAYSVTHVNEDGTIPTRPVANWRVPGLNTFRSNSQGSGVTSPFAAADLRVTEVTSACDRTTGVLSLRARVVNQGDAAASAGLRVAFFQGNPAAGGTLLGVALVPSILPAGSSAVATLALASAPGGSAEVWAVADNDGTGTGREVECDENNNGGSALVSLACSSNAPPIASCRDLTLPADAATCRAPASVDDGSYDPDQQPGPLSVTQVPTGPFGPGTHAVTLTVSDGQASDTCSATVTVVDVTPPTLSCPAPLVVEATGPDGAPVNPAAASAADTCGPPAVSGPAAGTYPRGATPVTYTATDAAGNSVSCGSVIYVVDRERTPPKFTPCNLPRYTRDAQLKVCGFATSGAEGVPVITVLLSVDGGAPVALTPDANGGLVLTFLELSEGHHTLSLTAIDAQGGVASRVIPVTVDRTAPTLRLVSPRPGEPRPGPVVELVSEVGDLSPVRLTLNWTYTLELDAGVQTARQDVSFTGVGEQGVFLQAMDAAGNVSELFTHVLIQP